MLALTVVWTQASYCSSDEWSAMRKLSDNACIVSGQPSPSAKAQEGAGRLRINTLCILPQLLRLLRLL